MALLQIVETLVRHRQLGGGEARRRARELLDLVQVRGVSGDLTGSTSCFVPVAAHSKISLV
jgi:hypothetical protein